MGYFLITTIWNSIAAWLFLGIFWLIGFLISDGTFNVLTWTNEEMAPGVPFWVIWWAVVLILGYLRMWEDDHTSRT